jgi:hypothetical protein
MGRRATKGMTTPIESNSAFSRLLAAITFFALLPLALGTFRQGLMVAALLALLLVCGILRERGSILTAMLLALGLGWALAEPLRFGFWMRPAVDIWLTILVIIPFLYTTVLSSRKRISHQARLDVFLLITSLLLAVVLYYGYKMTKVSYKNGLALVAFGWMFWLGLRSHSHGSMLSSSALRKTWAALLALTILWQAGYTAIDYYRFGEKEPLSRIAYRFPNRIERTEQWLPYPWLSYCLNKRLYANTEFSRYRGTHSASIVTKPQRAINMCIQAKDSLIQKAIWSAVMETEYVNAPFSMARNRQLALFGGKLPIRMPNRCVSLTHRGHENELAVLRENGELYCITFNGSRMHVFEGDLGKAVKVRATPGGYGYVALFERGETRYLYFGARQSAAYSIEGGVKYGMKGRAVDLVLDDKGLLVLSAVGAVYRVRSGSDFEEVMPELFPGQDRARGLALNFKQDKYWVVDAHGEMIRRTLNDPSDVVRLKYDKHYFPPPEDDAVALIGVPTYGPNRDVVSYYWLDAWGGVHYIHNGRNSGLRKGKHDRSVSCTGDLAMRDRRGECVDVAFTHYGNRVLVLNAYGEIHSYPHARYVNGRRGRLPGYETTRLERTP